MAMTGSVVKAAPKQLRHRTNEEKEADRVSVRDIRRSAEVLRDGVGQEFRRHYRPRLARWQG